MNAVISVVAPIFLAAASWIIVEFAGRPVRDFFTLRRQVRHQMLVFGNVPARWKQVEASTGPAAPTDIDEAGDRRLQQAQQTFRDLGSQIVAFAEVEWPATYVVRLLGFDAAKVGRALFSLSNNIATYGQGRADSLQAVETLLKLKATDQ